MFFSHIGIFTHNWYLSILTLAGFFIYSLIIKKWYELLLEDKQRKLLITGSLFLGTFALAGNSIITSLNLLKIQMFQLSVSNQYVKNHLYGSLLYGPALVIMFIILHKAKIHPAAKALFLLPLFFAQYLLYSIGFIKIMDGWFIIIACVDILGYYAWVILLDRFFLSRFKKLNKE